MSSSVLQQPDYDRILEKQDFFPKIFLMPSQIKLDKQHGIRVIKRYDSHQDKFEQQAVQPISIDEKTIRAYNENHQQQKSQHPAGHGLLSLFKRTSQRRIKLAICICVYSQPKHMLKGTIKGIQQSYKYFLQNAGILPHQIILTVIFDGIQKVNNELDQSQNMISFFTQIDIKNGFTQKPYAKSLDQFIKELQQKNFNLSILKQDKVDDISLFTEDQLTNLQHKLFENQYNQYIRIQKLLKEVQKLKHQKQIRIDQLPVDVNKRYEELSLNFCIQNNMWYQTQQQIQQYLSAKKNLKFKLIFQALQDTERLCIKYLQSRQQTAILYPVRLQTDDLKGQQRDQELNQKKQKQYNYMFFCVKHKNQGKLSSHMLFFEGFCKLFDPEYCMLTDVGVKPQKDAIYKMYQHMEKNPKCGGVCGYMGLRIQNPADELGYRDDGFDPEQHGCLSRLVQKFISVQRAQQFQYHFAHMLDKPFQSFFNYIHVLPGAFSGYRWKALKSISYKGQQKVIDDIPSSERAYLQSSDQLQESQTLMRRYLKTAKSKNLNLSLQDSNMYLAEDRIMCLGIHALGYDLHYLPDAQSVVDPVTSLTRLLGQRRRWINGSWFAFNYVREHSYEIDSWVFMIQLFYYSLVQKLTWIAISIFYVAMNLTLVQSTTQYVVPMIQRFFGLTQDYQLSNYNIWVFNVKNIAYSFPDLINFIYILHIFAITLFSVLVNHNNTRFKKIYYAASTLFGLYGLIVLALLIYNTYAIIFSMSVGNIGQNFIININILRWLIIFVIIGHAVPVLWTFSFRKAIQIVTSLISYLFYVPTFINILYVFAFCRIDDLSWGTKGLDKDESQSTQQRQWQKKKYIFVLQFVSTNAVLSYVLIKATNFTFVNNLLILSMTIMVAFLLFFRLLFAFLYLAKYYITRPWKKFTPAFINQNKANGNRILKALHTIQIKMKQIQKQRTKKKKEEEYKRLANATSFILSKTLSNYGSKVRSKVTQHLVNNNIVPKKDLLNQKNTKQKKRFTLKKNLGTVEQSNNQNQESRQDQLRKEEQQEEEDRLLHQNTKRTQIKARIQAIKGKRRDSPQQIKKKQK